MTDTHGPLALRPGTAPVRLPPQEAFPDEYTPTDTLLKYCPRADPAETGPDSRTIGVVIARRCCGWRKPPTPREVYDAMRADDPTGRQLDAMTVVLNESTFDEVVLAHLEGAFTWQQLARAVHRRGGVTPERVRSLARFARASP